MPKNPDPSKMPILRTQTPAISVQTLPLEGPRILRVKQIHHYSAQERLMETLVGQLEVNIQQKTADIYKNLWFKIATDVYPGSQRPNNKE